MDSMIKVRMADYGICSVPQKITTIGLGSCVGIVIFDSKTGRCGLLHAMLPDSTRIRNNSNRSKFVDSGLEDMLQEMLKQGTNMKNLTAKMAGGAAMFDFSEENDITSIGAQNVQAAKELLAQFKIPLLAEDTGKNYGRTIIFNPETGGLTIRAVGQPEIVI
ncbi:MAG: chemotaxis protein CheD [Clostridium sp.]|jgi:chemotaxis protein CheD|nr:chemotaxis protein CheD [Clostridium sp.]